MIETYVPKLSGAHIQALNDLASLIHQNAVEKGFYDKEETDGEFIARSTGNLHGEVSEWWEAFRTGKLNQPCDKAAAMSAAGLSALTCEEEELADVIIRALDIAKRRKVNIGKAVAMKHLFNKTRAHRHGGKVA